MIQQTYDSKFSIGDEAWIIGSEYEKNDAKMICPFCKGTGQYKNALGKYKTCNAVIGEYHCENGSLYNTRYIYKPHKLKILGATITQYQKSNGEVVKHCTFSTDVRCSDIEEDAIYMTEEEAQKKADELNESERQNKYGE